MDINNPQTDKYAGVLAFEVEPDWDSLPDPIPSTTVAAILKISRKTLTKYVQIGKYAPPADRGVNSAHYRKADVIGYWRMRQVRIADGSIKAELDPNSERARDMATWEAEDEASLPPRWRESGQGVDMPPQEGIIERERVGEREIVGPIPGGGVDSLPEPREDVNDEDVTALDLVSLTRADFEAMLTRLWEQAQAPLVAQLEASQTRVGELVESQTKLVTAQREFLERQATAQSQQAEQHRQQAEAWRLMMDEQRRLTGQVAELNQRLQTRTEQEEAARLRAEAEPANAWERFLRTLHFRVR